MSRHAIDVRNAGEGDFAISVDSRRWCYAIREAHGMHGASYKFHYTTADDPIKEKGRDGADVVVWSDKHWLRSQGFYGRPDMARRQAVLAGKYKTLRDRVEEAAARLIQEKLLISPEEREQRREALAAITRRKREEFEAASRKRLDEKAHEVVRAALREGGLSKADRNRLGLLIVEAMEWARSNT